MDCKELIVVKDEPFNELLPSQTMLPEPVFLSQRNQIPGEVIANPQWLQNGWKTERKIRKTGLTAGHADKYYLEPVNGTKFRSKAEVIRFLETVSRHKSKISTGISNARAQSDDSASGCNKPVYYYRPVLCQSPLYAEHPGLYPVIYFPVIGNSEDPSTNPPMEFLQNFGDLKPILAQPSEVPSPLSPNYQKDLFTEAFGQQDHQCSNIPSKKNHCHTVSETVPVDVECTSETKRKPRLDCGLAALNAAEIKTPSSSSLHQMPDLHENSSRASNPISSNLLALSCDKSSFTVTTAAIDHQYSPSSVLEQHYVRPSASQTKPCNARMRGQLSPAQLNLFN